MTKGGGEYGYCSVFPVSGGLRAWSATFEQYSRNCQTFSSLTGRTIYRVQFLLQQIKHALYRSLVDSKVNLTLYHLWYVLDCEIRWRKNISSKRVVKPGNCRRRGGDFGQATSAGPGDPRPKTNHLSIVLVKRMIRILMPRSE